MAMRNRGLRGHSFRKNPGVSELPFSSGTATIIGYNYAITLSVFWAEHTIGFVLPPFQWAPQQSGTIFPCCFPRRGSSRLAGHVSRDVYIRTSCPPKKKKHDRNFSTYPSPTNHIYSDQLCPMAVSEPPEGHTHTSSTPQQGSENEKSQSRQGSYALFSNAKSIALYGLYSDPTML